MEFRKKLPYGEILELTDTLRYSTNLRGNKDSEESNAGFPKDSNVYG